MGGAYVIMKNIVFIFGCQRSGTSILSEAFAKVPDTKSYLETNTELSDNDNSEKGHTIRLNRLDDVREKIYHRPHKNIVIKPIVESQRALDILNFFPESKAIWIYRNPKSVAVSMTNKWGKQIGHNELKTAISGGKLDWRSQNLHELEKIYLRAMAANCTNTDAAGMFWYSRNSHFFRQSLKDNQRVKLLEYDTLVKTPIIFNNFLHWLGFTEKLNVSDMPFNTNSVDKGDNMVFSSNINALLESMKSQLDFHYNHQWPTKANT